MSRRMSVKKDPFAASPAGPRLSRVVMAYYLENFDQAVADFSAAFGLEMETKNLDDLGLRVAWAFEEGIEFIAPLSEGAYAPMTLAWLDEHGEGLQQVILEVPDLAQGVAKAEAAGLVNGGFRIDCFDANESWRERYRKLEEAPLSELNKVQVTLIEKVPHGAS